MFCRHCRKSPVSRPRGLCWNCYYEPGVRDRYPRKFIAPVYKNRNQAPPPPHATPARPGSREKIAVLRRRFMLRCQLWHPHDARE